MTLEELLFGLDSNASMLINPNTTNTRTYEVNYINPKFKRMFDIPLLITKLIQFNTTYEHLREQPRESLYHTFHIPKKSGGLRRIDAPNTELMSALRTLKDILEQDFKALYHTSAFAYVKERSTVDALKRHQQNESKWFGKYDLSNFFGSTTLDFVMKMLGMIFPFSEVVQYRDGKEQLAKALELGFLNGVLPQGTPLSPTLTNIMMIPIDHTLARTFRDWNNQRFVYTRYADDYLISSKYDFRFREVEQAIVETLKEFDAPFTLNSSKTRYGSSAGRNWNLGLMLGKDNKITVGHQRKRQFWAMLTHYVTDKLNGVNWDLHDVQTMDGYRNYFSMVEGKEYINGIIKELGDKFGVDIVKMIKQDLRV
jgi:hypothetical protein